MLYSSDRAGESVMPSCFPHGRVRLFLPLLTEGEDGHDDAFFLVVDDGAAGVVVGAAAVVVAGEWHVIAVTSTYRVLCRRRWRR